jgi:hypothetical protein
MHSLAVSQILVVFLIVANAIAQESGVKPENGPAVMSVCDVFTNLRNYSGKNVAVRGHARYGREWIALGDPKCGLPFSGHPKDWPRVIVLQFQPPGLHPPGGSRSNQTELDRALKILSFQDQGSPEELGVDVEFTAVGELHTVPRRLPSAPKESEGVLPWISEDGGGFGHLAAFPAEIVCRSIKDIVIRQVR